MIAHEYVAGVYEDLVALGAIDEVATELLYGSANVVLRQMAEATAEVRHLESAWHEQELLDPETAACTATEIEAAMARIRPQLNELITRQRELVRRMRELLERARGG
jgi:carboxylesterase type B